MNLPIKYINRKENRTLDGQVTSVEELMKFCAKDAIRINVGEYRNGKASAKGLLPAFIFQGYPLLSDDARGARLAQNMVSNRKYLIDLDHIEDKEDWTVTPENVWNLIKTLNDFDKWNVQLAFITPSGKGLKIVCEMKDTDDSILDCQRAFAEHFCVGKWYDEVNIDYSRLAFVPKEDDILYISDDLFTLKDYNQERLRVYVSMALDERLPEAEKPEASKPEPAKAGRAALNQEELKSYEDYEFRGHSLKDIVSEWTQYRGEQLGIIVNGKPFAGEVHSLHYNILRDIRNVCDNNPVLMTAMMPTFGHDVVEIFNQAKKVCSYNTNGRIPSNVWHWMKERGYLGEAVADVKNIYDDDDDDSTSPYDELLSRMPELPPIIKDWVKAAPQDFKIPTIAALLEILGTCTTYAQAEYFDGLTHTTSFFSVIWAEAAGGKSFVKKFLYLLEKIRSREDIINARERLYDSLVNTRSDNKDKPEKPTLCKRILEPKFSEVQLFTQCFENKGAHLHTYCPEIDTLGRGVRGLSDLLRIAWDNDATGQQFRSSQTFKGTVNLFWNVLVTGTPERVLHFFNDVTDGLVTRITIAPIFASEFAPYQSWKKIPEKTLQKHYDLIEKFDEQTYVDPIEVVTPEMLAGYSDLKAFDSNIKWKFEVRPRITRDLSYLHKPLMEWTAATIKQASLAPDNAYGTFCKRSANKGFRAALIANELWGNPTSEKMQQKIKDFCMWWSEVEHFSTYYVFGTKYNKKRAEVKADMENFKPMRYGSLWDTLPEDFTIGDVVAKCAQMHIASKPRGIVSLWNKDGLIVKLEKNHWKKK